mmetsp:Transcript_5147/g.15609  ORF Transcript_5147/g.15609 Transcript_5147/m.15609 type:complete len:443 (+) Transcript_5147:139-1467(+)
MREGGAPSLTRAEESPPRSESRSHRRRRQMPAKDGSGCCRGKAASAVVRLPIRNSRNPGGRETAGALRWIARKMRGLSPMANKAHVHERKKSVRGLLGLRGWCEQKCCGQPPMRIMGLFSWACWARPSGPSGLPPWAKCLWPSARWTAAATAASSWPARRRSRRERASLPKRQVLRAPSVVILSRLQPEQKWLVMEEMTPSLAGWPARVNQRVVSLGSAAWGSGRSRRPSRARMSTISSAGTSFRERHSFAEKGIHSMKRRLTRGLSAKYRTRSARPASFEPRTTTQLTLTDMPSSASAAAIASRTRACVAAGRRVSVANASGHIVSSETFTLRMPAAYSASSSVPPRADRRSRPTPFVVMPTDSIPGCRAIEAHSSTRSARSVGSPPVSRIFVVPSPANTDTSRSISSLLSTFSARCSSTPSAGMQYVHRRLHRSVNEMRR